MGVEYTFKPGVWVDTVEVTLVRPAKRGKYTVGVTFEVDDDGLLELGAVEQCTYTLNLIDRYPQPDYWEYGGEHWFGAYSEEKYAFFVTVLGKLYDPWGMDLPGANRQLRQALKEYNDTHEVKKDFTFPER